MKSHPDDYYVDLVVLDDRKYRTKTHLKASAANTRSPITKAAKKLLMKEVERIHALKNSP